MMRTEYAVYMEGTQNNDEMDWFGSYEEAFEATNEMDGNLEENKSLYLSKVTDGEFEDFPLELRMEGGEIHQYKAGKCLWL